MFCTPWNTIYKNENKQPCLQVLAYRRMCNSHCQLLKDAKKKHYCDLIYDCAGGSKKLFKNVNSHCNYDPKAHWRLTPIHVSLRMILFSWKKIN